MRRTGFAIGFFILLLLHSLAQGQAGDWRHYNGDLASSKYAPLDQIDRDNFADLRVVWRYRPPDQKIHEANPNVRLNFNKSTPLEVDGVLYAVSPYNIVCALDAATGAELWTFDAEVWKDGNVAALGMFRGLTYWSEGDDERLFLATQNNRLYALDPKDGRPLPEFGAGGYVDLTQGLRRAVDPEGYMMTSPPVVSRGIVVVGSSVLDVRYRPTPQYAAPGDVRGFDARSGELVWTFETIPQEGAYGNETWGEESWRRYGGVNVWSMMSVDEELGYVYMPVSTPSDDFYGGERPGDNLFGDSIVCLDVATGERVWHYQLIHHGIWDYDPPAAPILVDIEVDGKPIKAVAQLTKQAFCFVFDRITGEPVWPIEERPVPQSTVEGEQTSPTQPFPTKPAPFDWQGVSEENLIDFTPELRQQALEIIAEYDYGPLYTPPTERGTLLVPGLWGSANWAGAAWQPDKGTLYIPSHTLPDLVKLHPAEGDEVYTPFYGTTHGRVAGPDNLPLLKPPYGRLVAIDLNTGDQRWMVPLGRGPVDHPALKGLGIEGDLGWDAFGFVLATDELLLATMSDPRDLGDAGRSYFVDRETALYAFDLDSGAKLGRVPLPSNANGSPMTYMAGGRQYIVVPQGSRNDRPPEWVALALPREGEKLPNQPGLRDDAGHGQFYAALAALDAGDLELLQRLLVEHDGLAGARGFLDEYYEYPALRGATLLHLAAGQPQRAPLPANAVELARALLAAGVDPNAVTLDSTYALELVLGSNQAEWAGFREELITTLVEGGADPGINGSKFVWNALVNEQTELATMLADRGAPLDLRLAAGLNRVDRLADFFAADGTLRPAANSLYRTNPDTVFSDQQVLDEALHFAVYGEGREAIDFLLAKGADINSHVGTMWSWDWGTTPLIKAVDVGDLELIRYLVDRGGDLTIAEPRWNETPYVWSTYYNGEGRAELTAALKEMEAAQREAQGQKGE